MVTVGVCVLAVSSVLKGACGSTVLNLEMGAVSISLEPWASLLVASESGPLSVGPLTKAGNMGLKTPAP